jgi:4-hydroxy-tetrahydrodipicolinate synthase
VTGELDEPAWRALLRLYAEQGVHGVLVNGTTGEWFSQSPAERRRVAEVAVEELAGRTVVVIGCSSYTPEETVAYGQHARSIGADGVLATPPPYVHPSSDEIYAYYRAVTEAVDLPWMVYNWPRGTAVDIPASLASRLADLDRVVAIKDSTGDWLKMLDCLEEVFARVRFFGSFIHRRGLAVLREIGGDGSIDGGGLGAPFATTFYEALWQDDLTTARAAASRYVGFASRVVNADYSAKFASPTSQLKAAMALLGQPGGQVRPPLLPLTDSEALRSLRAAVEISGLREALGPEQPSPAH